ncbi:hypothetical protein D3C85_961830 [compost metagenome]
MTFLALYFSSRLTTVHNTSRAGRTMANSTARRSPWASATVAGTGASAMAANATMVASGIAIRAPPMPTKRINGAVSSSCSVKVSADTIKSTTAKNCVRLPVSA